MGEKLCTKCHQSKSVDNFYIKKNGKICSHCKLCHLSYCKYKPEKSKIYRDKYKKKISKYKKDRYRNTYIHQVWLRAKQRAKLKGLDFNIVHNDIIIPEFCPVYGMKLEIGLDDKNNSPCIDRIDNTKGYIKGNIVIISSKANRVKNNGTLEEHQKIYDFYENLENIKSKLVYQDDGV